MIIICYDISNDKLRTQFSKFLEQYGYRLQYSVFEIKNSNRLLNLIKGKIEGRFAKQFDGGDSVLIFTVGDEKVIKYGNAIHRDEGLTII